MFPVLNGELFDKMCKKYSAILILSFCVTNPRPGWFCSTGRGGGLQSNSYSSRINRRNFTSWGSICKVSFMVPSSQFK